MSQYCCCNPKFSCTPVALIVSLIAGVVAAFLQITGSITVTPTFLWAALGTAVVYLVVLEVVSALQQGESDRPCVCAALNALLAGLLGTALFALVLLAVGIVATSVLSAVLVGFLVLFLTLVLTATACLIRCFYRCNR